MNPPLRARSKNLVIQQSRGLAILAVFVVHFSLITQLLGSLPVRVVNSGYLGVELFFVISGFVVTQSLQRGNWDPRHFAVRRIFRLYPALLLFLALSALVWLATAMYPPNALARQVFGARDLCFITQGLAVLTGTLTLLRDPPLYVNGATWSLSIEFQFYAVLAVLIVVIRRTGGEARACERALLCLSLLVACCYGMMRLALVAGFDPPLAGDVLWKRFDFLAAGTLLALAPERWLQRLALKSPGLVFVSMVSLPFLSLMAFRSPLPIIQPNSHDWLEIIGYPLTLLGFTWAIAAAAVMDDEGVGSSPSGRAMLWLGDRSYSLYLIHFPLFALVWMAFYETNLSLVSNPWIYSLAQFAIGLPLILWIAELCFRHIEQPGIRLGSALSRPPEQPARRLQAGETTVTRS